MKRRRRVLQAKTPVQAPVLLSFMGTTSRLRRRLEKLETQRGAAEAITRSGIVVQLPESFVGERHIVMIDRTPTGSPHQEWCIFQERPGPGPNEADGAQVIYVSEADMRM
jgi:hypothetical protein